jgi:hypothetical protein
MLHMANDRLDRPATSAKEAPSLQRQDERRPSPPAKPDPLVDMTELASRITTAPASPADNAAPARHMEKLGELAVRTIESFGALPTAELDEMIRSVKTEIAKLETEAQDIRNTYVAHTDRLAAAITRLGAGCRLAKETLDKLREQCAALSDQPQ